MKARKLNAALPSLDDLGHLEARLTRAYQGVLEFAARRAAERFQKFASSPAALVAAPGVTGRSAMVAVYPTAEQQAMLARPGGEDADVIHCTLAFLGEPDPDQVEAAIAELRNVADTVPTLTGEVGGVACFGDNGDGYPSIVLPDVDGLAELRHAVCEALDAAGIERATNHGWTPHLTLSYSEKAETPHHSLIGLPLEFGTLSISVGDVRRDLDLAGGLVAGAVVAKSETGKKVGEVAEKYGPDSAPDYGDCWWNEAEGKVLWITADYTGNEALENAPAEFLAIDGVESVEDCDECGAPEGDEWELVYDNTGTESVIAAGSLPPWTQPHPDELVNVDDLIERFRNKSNPVREAVIGTVAKPALKAAGIDFDLTNPLVAAVYGKVGQHITYIAETTRLNAMRIVRRSYEEGLSIPDTADALRAGMEAASATRATLIARTEMTALVNGTSLASTQIIDAAISEARDSGEEDAQDFAGYHKRWLTAEGAHWPRHEDYDGLDGQTVPLEEPFEVGGVQLQYPGDPDGPPEEVCNCRCTVVYVDAAGGEQDAEDLQAAATSPLPFNDDTEGGGSAVKPKPYTTEAVKQALVAAGETLEPTPSIGTSYELTQGSLAHRKFLAAAIDAGYTEMRGGSWPCESVIGDHGETLFADEGVRVFRLDDGRIASLSISHGWAELKVAAPTRELASSTVAEFSLLYPPTYRQQQENENVVPITFWTDGQWGPTSRLRMIDSANWDDIGGNYSGEVRDGLGRLMSPDFTPGKNGQLLLWQGPPGTGKTWALRALASQWSEWAEFNYITDPDAFFVSNPSYMIDVLLHGSYEELAENADGGVDVVTSTGGDKWRVLILEDTGELLAANAKESYGQGLSRLLNVVDGMVGQGLRVLALLTTNDELDDLHPAAVRPGRCASQIEFGPLSAAEAEAWLADRVPDHIPSEDGYTLAELFEIAGQSEAAFAPVPMEGDCSSCGHAAADHAGALNDGACDVEGCDCEAFAEAATEAAVAASAPGNGMSVAVRIRPELDPTFHSTIAEGVSAAVNDGLRRITYSTETVAANGEVIDAPVSDIRPERTDSIEPPEVEVRTDAQQRWFALLAPEGKVTDDGRLFAPGSIGWRDLPLTLMAMTETPAEGGHAGAELAGRIDRIWRDDLAGLPFWIKGEGAFDDADYGENIARLVGDQTLRGNSVDLAIRRVEFGPRDLFVDENGLWRDDAPAEGEVPEPTMDELFSGDLIMVVRDAVIGMSTVCPFPAFEDANIILASGDSGDLAWTIEAAAGGSMRWRVWVRDGIETGAVLTASAEGMAPLKPPAEWFADPELEELTALTITEDGQVFGHAWVWDECHIGIPGACVVAPHSKTDYAYFHLKEVECEDGARVAVGTITLGTGHANDRASRKAATEHYDHTGTAVADVRIYEDEFGGVVAGALRPDVPAGRVREFRGSTPSGDWRKVNGNLELVGLLAVNVPGFPVPRAKALVASVADGLPDVLSLVAAGIPTTASGTGEVEFLDDVERAKLAALSARATGGLKGLAALARSRPGRHVAPSIALVAAPVWDSETGLMDVMADISEALNPGDTFAYYVVDVAIGGESAIIAEWSSDTYWLVALTYDAGDPVLPPQTEWTEVESEWVSTEAAAGFNAYARKRLAALAGRVA